MSELNPNHPVTREVHDHWHKIVGVIMAKLDLTEVELLPEDIDRLGENEKCVVADARGGKFIVRLMPMAEAEKLAREAGGFPV